ncbi:MAG: response regulator, partial [Myxococcales bacterium]|nr:response regulator [Myxococcales bacterium]
MSHELRTPLNAVLGFTQLLTRDAGLTAAQRERMGIIERSGRHLLAQIDEVLEMSRIEAGTVSVDDGAVEVRALCDEVAEMFVVPCERKGLALEVIIDGDVPAWMRGDAAKLGRVLVNLVGNAVKYTERGGIGLRVVRAGEGAVAFEVQDTGPGLACGDIERLFEPFARGEQGRATSGTGLGLSITRELTALLGGRVDVESEPGRGSCFRVVLPLREAGAAASPAAEPPIAELRAPGGGALPAVLVVEDQAENRRLMAELLEPLGFAVTLAESGEAAVARFAVASAGVVLMDLRMPGVDGGEAARRIRALPGGAAAAIVAVTASAFRDEGAEVVAAPFDAVVRKPFRADRLLEVVAEHAGLEVVRGAVAPARSAPVELAAGDFAALPGDVVATLHQAAIAADGERIERVLGAIAATHAGLCDGVRDLLDSYRFDRLAALTIAS